MRDALDVEVSRPLPIIRTIKLERQNERGEQRGEDHRRSRDRGAE